MSSKSVIEISLQYIMQLMKDTYNFFIFKKIEHNMASYKVLICTFGSVSELVQHELEIKKNMGTYLKIHSF